MSRRIPPASTKRFTSPGASIAKPCVNLPSFYLGAVTTSSQQLSNSALTQQLKVEARALGFSACGIAAADAAPQTAERLRAWLAEGMHGDMLWMEERAAQRGSPHGLWPEVRSVIMLGMSYAPATDPLALADARDRGRISVYAQGQDYHDVVKKALKALARWLVAQSPCDLKVFVDTAPVMEKPLAQAAGIGWQGKHSNLVSRTDGSWLFLGAIMTTLDLPPDAPHADRCGSCTACQQACPTDAFPEPYRVDARRCISYLTIEHKGPIPHEYRPAIGNRIYGCDDCLAVCPWNKFASVTREAKLAAREDLLSPALGDFLAMDEEAFRIFFSANPVKRIGHARFLRNVLIAAGNSRHAGFVQLVEARLTHPSPLVRGAAVWALSQLDPMRARDLAPQNLPLESDAQVCDEWRRAIATSDIGT